MNKQGEIRKGIGEKLEDVFSELDHWDCSEECGHRVCLVEWRDNLIGELLAYLHSQGCVLRVDKELPKPNIQLDEKFRMGWDACGGAITNAGYVATAPLVEK